MKYTAVVTVNIIVAALNVIVGLNAHNRLSYINYFFAGANIGLAIGVIVYATWHSSIRK